MLKRTKCELNCIVLFVFHHCLLAGVYYVAFCASKQLEWVRISIPQYRIPGESAVLECDYDLGTETLYSVKWYKKNEEFYRYIPANRPSATWYKVPGIKVHLQKSDSKHVYLEDINWQTSGLYKCEVSAEAPYFSSALSEGRMEIVSFAEENPTITISKQWYKIGNEINLNCTSGKSNPAPVLQWYINEQQILTPEVLIRYPEKIYEGGLRSSKVGLKFMLSNKHFLGGSMRVKCVSSVMPVLLQRTDRETTTLKSLHNDRRQAVLLVSSTSVTELAHTNTEEGDNQ